MQRGSLYNKIQLPEGNDHIRLVRVQSDITAGEVTCELETVRLSEAPPYFALSYTWQSPLLRQEPGVVTIEEEHLVRCNNELLAVFYNLYHALLRLGQEPFRGRYFWIDRISIDQENTTERNHQVDLMAEIFKAAQEVIVWLGPGDQHTKPATELLQKLYEIGPDLRQAIRPQNLGSQVTQTALGSDLNENAPWISLSHLFRRNWFSRAWVVQEILLAKRIIVLCGEYSIDWEHLQEVSHFLATTPWTRAYADPEFLGYDTILPFHTSPTSLVAAKRDLASTSPFLNSLIRAKRHHCGMAIDKVFSLYGIARKVTPQGVRAPHADYNLSVSKAYTEATVNVLQSSEDLHVLAYAEGSKFRTVENLPSWVPDWSCRELIGLGVTGYKRYHAASKSNEVETEEQRVEFAPSIQDARVLKLRAAYLDTVVACGESKREVMKTMRFSGWLEILQSLERQYSPEQTRLEAFWRTIIYDTGDDGKCPARAEIGNSFRNWLKTATDLSPDDNTLLDVEDCDSAVNKEDAWLFQLCFGFRTRLRLFRTERGFLGLGTESMGVGDEVWIVPGSRVPLVMQRRVAISNDGSQCLELVGGTYLHGFMHGEAFQGIQRDGKSTSLEFHTIAVV